LVDEIVARLLDSAIRFTPAGRISVGVELMHRQGVPYPAATLEISVADTGIGIADERRGAIYKPFYQVDDGSDRQVGGTGLGLAIVRRLVELMDGEITLASEVGAGSTFRVSIPVEICKSFVPANVASSPARRGSRPAAANQPLEGSVLLAEDNEFNAMLAAELLTLMGLKVTLAADGAVAHRAAEAHRFDVILMDCQMPNLDGYEATRRIRQAELAASKPPVPIIAVTANALAGDREKCLAAGMDDYLAKPYTVAQLRSKLIAWLPEPADRPSVPSSSVAARAIEN
jgi:CheY-like chemotaxis protein